MALFLTDVIEENLHNDATWGLIFRFLTRGKQPDKAEAKRIEVKD